MSQQAEKVLAEALLLSEDERMHVVSKLLETVEGEDEEIDLGPEWEAEIKRRIDLLDRGEMKAIPWSEAQKMIFDDAPIPD